MAEVLLWGLIYCAMGRHSGDSEAAFRALRVAGYRATFEVAHAVAVDALEVIGDGWDRARATR